MSEPAVAPSRARRGRVYACVVSSVSLLRGIEIMVRARPRTLLRVLCAVTFDTVYKLRTSRRLPFHRLEMILMLLECGACINRHFDRKGFDRHAYRGLRTKLKQAGMNRLAVAYTKQIKAIENGRPSPGGDALRYQDVRAYREAVIRLSLALVTAAAFDFDSPDDGLAVLRDKGDFEIICRIVMQCQVIDDVLDERKDRAAGLPSFLTATVSRGLALEMTEDLIADYREAKNLEPTRAAFAFQIALAAVSAIAWFVLQVKRQWDGC